MSDNCGPATTRLPFTYSTYLLSAETEMTNRCGLTDKSNSLRNSITAYSLPDMSGCVTHTDFQGSGVLVTVGTLRSCEPAFSVRSETARRPLIRQKRSIGLAFRRNPKIWVFAHGAILFCDCRNSRGDGVSNTHYREGSGVIKSVVVCGVKFILVVHNEGSVPSGKNQTRSCAKMKSTKGTGTAALRADSSRRRRNGVENFGLTRSKNPQSIGDRHRSRWH